MGEILILVSRSRSCAGGHPRSPSGAQKKVGGGVGGVQVQSSGAIMIVIGIVRHLRSHPGILRGNLIDGEAGDGELQDRCLLPLVLSDRLAG